MVARVSPCYTVCMLNKPKLLTRKEAPLLAAAAFITCLLLPVFLWFAAPYYTYQLYMGLLASGVHDGYWHLPPKLVSELAPHYAHDISLAAYAYTARLPKNLAVGDCKTIYFGDSEIVAHLRAGTPLTTRELRWLSHELTHGEQCERWGGRKKFAKTWFREAGTEAWRVVRGGEGGAAVREYLRTKYVKNLHDAMPMEVEADERARSVLDAR
jgi:hypothetical protein